jgi:hypothetical protein
VRTRRRAPAKALRRGPTSLPIVCSGRAFAAGWGEAEERAADALEAEAWRRAVVGVQEPLVSGGKVVRDDDGQPIAIRRYSDALMITLLKARRPDRFKDRAVVEHDITDPRC